MNSGAVCPGLIEAQDALDDRFLAQLNSGAVCPGLIEAGSSFGSGVRRVHGIPGQSAPASLKRAAFPTDKTLEQRQNSGAVCPGLIEA